MNSKSSEIVVGIDFGTTHSGVSWAVNGGSKNIRLINTWPDPHAQNASKEKVPSSISYVDGGPQKWGYIVGLNDESFRWIKILLEENHEYANRVDSVKDSNALLRKANKSAQDVVADYLRLLWEYTLDDIRKLHPDYEDIFDLRVVLTVPAIWSPAAKDKTLKAARSAGMPREVKLVTEPEAAALATLKDKDKENQLRVNDAFVVCDAGGGTVDLISYEVQSLNPLRIRECAIGSGGLCGSTFLDVAFAKYIENLVGEMQYGSIKENYRKRMMREFEYGIKRCFSGNNDPTFSVELRGVRDDPNNGIVDDTIVINPVALSACFDQVIQQIQKLVASQIAEVAESGLYVKAVLLVGGFGESRFLFNRLKACHEPSGIQVLQVNGAWSCVCRGATLWGLEHPPVDTRANPSLSPEAPLTTAPTVTSRLSRYSYGMSFSEPYEEKKHLFHDVYKDTKTGSWMARKQMTWLLKRGDEILDGRILTTNYFQTVKVGFWDKGNLDFMTNLWYCEELKAPTRQTSAVKPLCSVYYSVNCDVLWREKSFRSPIDGSKHRNATFQIFIVLGNAGLDFMVAYRGDVVGHVEARYLQKFD